MKIGIIGAGKMGAGFGKALAAKGHQVMYSYSRDQRKLDELALATPGALTGSPQEAAEFGEVVLLSVWVPQVDDVLSTAGPSLAGKILLTCVSGLQPDFSGSRIGIPTELTEGVAETIARKVPQAMVVESLNLTFAEILDSDSRDFGEQQPSLLYCGDDARAKSVVAGLIADCGYHAIDAGALRVSRCLETLATAWVQLAVVGQLFPGAGLHILRR